MTDCKLPICTNTEECCRELSRVWDTLGVTTYNSKSASENVAAIRAERDALAATVARVQELVGELTENVTRLRGQPGYANALKLVGMFKQLVDAALKGDPQ